VYYDLSVPKDSRCSSQSLFGSGYRTASPESKSSSVLALHRRQRNSIHLY
jgi:hypothetical protein